MNTHAKRAAWAAACVMCVTTACKDIPLLPQWDTSWNVPLPSQAIGLPAVPIPNGFSIQDSFPTQQQALDRSVGSLLENAADTGSVILALTKRKGFALSGADTLFLSQTTAGLSTPGTGRIVIPIAFVATDSTVTDTVSTSLTIIRTAAAANGSIFVRFQGRVSNNSGAAITPGVTDSIHVRLALLALIHSSK